MPRFAGTYRFHGVRNSQKVMPAFFKSNTPKGIPQHEKLRYSGHVGSQSGIIPQRAKNVEYRIRLRRKCRMMNLEEGLQERLMNSNTRGGRQNGDPNERVA